MNSKWKTAIIWIIGIGVLALIVFVGMRDTIDRQMNPDITKAEWLSMLEDQFGTAYAEEDGDLDELVDGRFIAISSMTVLGEDRLKSITDEEINDSTMINIAVEKDVVSRKSLNRSFSRDDAGEVIAKLLELYGDPEYYPTYYEPQYKGGVVDITSFVVSDYNSDYTTFTIPRSEDADINNGNIVLIRNEYGIAEARKVIASTDNGDGTVSISATEVDDASDVMESVSFSGAADFSYLKNFVVDENDSANGESASVDTGKTYASVGSPLLLTQTVYAADGGLWERLTEKTAIQGSETSPYMDFSITIQHRTDEQGDDRWKSTLRYNGETLNPKLFEVKKDYQPESDDAHKIDFTEGTWISGDEGKGLNVNIDSKTELTIAFKNFSVTASGYAEWLDPGDEKNNIDVNVNSDIEITGKIETMAEGRYPLVTVPVPIAVTGGIVSIDFTLYMIVGLDGEVSFTYEINGAHAGMNISTKNGFVIRHGHESTNLSIDLNIEGYAGVRPEVAVCVLEEFKLVDPCMDVTAGASAETLDKHEGFEDYPPCIQLKAYAPTIKLKGHNSESTLAWKIINLLGVDDSVDIIDADYAYSHFFGKQLHIEEELDGSMNVLEGGEEVCTHITQEELSDVLEEKVQEEVDNQKQKFNEWIERKIEEWLNQWLAENCGGC